MSLILDALRKSEAERRRGQVPDLHTGPASSVPAARYGPPSWLWMTLALAAALVLALALWLARSTGIVQHRAAAEPGRDASIDTNTGIRARPPADTAAPATGDLAAPAPLTPGTTAPEALSAAEPVSAPRPMAAGDTTTISASTPVSAPTPRATPRQFTPRPDAIAKDRTAPAAEAVPAQESPAAAATASTLPAPARPTATSTIPAAGTPHASTMLLSDLSVSQREQLPPLRMSMHLWAPTQRFAIIDGARVAEGDRIADAVVEEITPGGVVLAWQGLRLHIPVR